MAKKELTPKNKNVKVKVKAPPSKRRTVPFYAVAGLWVFYALMFPLYRITDFITLGVLSFVVFVFFFKIIPAKKVNTPITQEEIKEELEAEPLTDIEKTLAEGELYLDAIKKLNVQVFTYNQNVSLEIAHLERSINKIFDYIRKNPEDAPKVRRFAEYYMPTVLKMLRSYVDIQSRGIMGDNANQIILNIEGTVHTMSIAFEKLMDKLYADEAMDISSDIKVLEHLFKQEGLTEDQLNEKK